MGIDSSTKERADSLLSTLKKLEKTLVEKAYLAIGEKEPKTYNSLLSEIKFNIKRLGSIEQYGRRSEGIVAEIGGSIEIYKVRIKELESKLSDDMKKIYSRPSCTKPHGHY